MNRWLAGLLGAAVLVIGAGLVVRPFQSLALMLVVVVGGLALSGAAELEAARGTREPWTRRLAGIVWVAAAIGVAVWPAISLEVLTWIIGLALLVTGAAQAWSAVRATTDERFASLLGGIASIVFGILALAWPDVTTFVVGVVFGVRLVILGGSFVVEAIRGRREEAAGDDRPSRGPFRWTRTAGAVAACGVALLLVVVSTRLNATEPDPDAFYDAPASVPAEPGQLLKAEPFTRGVPDGARAWRILYTTRRGDGTAALSSGLVVVPSAGRAPFPVVSWAHGTTGQDVSCAPSLLPEPFESGALFVLGDVIERGWALVATDYIGLGADPPHAYLVGGDAGRSVLDAARAARQLDGVDLSDETVVWGHSQGGASALWAGALAGDHAPEAGVIGVAALSPAANLPGLVEVLDGFPGGSIFASYVIEGYAAAYPEVAFDEYVRPAARIIVREMADRCLAERGALVSLIQALVAGNSIWAGDPSTGALAARVEANVPRAPIDVPLFMGQGADDTLVTAEAQRAYVDERCAAGGTLEYRTYLGFGHVDVVERGSPLIDDLLAWTAARWAGDPPPSTC